MALEPTGSGSAPVGGNAADGFGRVLVLCVQDLAALIARKETKILVFVYGVIITLVALGVEPYIAVSTALTAAYAMNKTLSP